LIIEAAKAKSKKENQKTENERTERCVKHVDVRRAVSAAGPLRMASAAAVETHLMNAVVSRNDNSTTHGKVESASSKKQK
jgi:hypothetical protein